MKIRALLAALIRSIEDRGEIVEIEGVEGGIPPPAHLSLHYSTLSSSQLPTTYA